MATSKKRFALPGKKTLHAADSEVEVLVVDVTETPVERPKKTATILLR